MRQKILLMLTLIMALGVMGRADVTLTGNGASATSAGDSLAIVVDTTAGTAISGETGPDGAISLAGSVTIDDVITLTANVGFGFAIATPTWDMTDHATSNFIVFSTGDGMNPRGAGTRFGPYEILWFEVTGLEAGNVLTLKGYTLGGNNPGRLKLYTEQSGGGIVDRGTGVAGYQTLAAPVQLVNGDRFGWAYQNTGGNKGSFYAVTFDISGAAANAPATLTPTVDPPAPANPAHPVEAEGIHLGVDPNGHLDIGYADIDFDELDVASILWTIEDQPDGSIATLDDATSATPILTVDTIGDYELSVIAAAVTGDITPAVGAITVVALDNWAPVANIRSASKNKTIYYDETLFMQNNSSDPDSDPCNITYLWEITAGDAGNIEFQDPCGISAPTMKEPTLVVVGGPESAGQYTIKLTIDDGDGLASIDSTNLTVLANVDPSADAGTDQFTSGAFPLSVALDGVVSDPDVYPKPYFLSSAWTVLSVPEGSAVDDSSFIDASEPNTAIILDAAGLYELMLIADDGGGNPANDTILITVTPYPAVLVSIDAVDDTHVKYNRAEIHGADTSMVARGTNWKGFVKFDVNGDVNGRIWNATLRLTAYGSKPGQTTVHSALYGPSGEWFEETFTNEIDNIGGYEDTIELDELDRMAEAGTVGGQAYDFNVTDMVLEFDGKATLKLVDAGAYSEPTTDISAEWRSKENATGPGPQLVCLVSPGCPHGLFPVDGLAEVYPDPLLTWKSGDMSVTDEVWLGGDAGSLSLAGTIDVAGDPNEYAASLALGEEYFWKVVSKDGSGTVIGESAIHTFWTMFEHPDIPINISPVDDDVNEIDQPIVFDFIEGEDANSFGQHNLLLSTDGVNYTEALSSILPGSSHPETATVGGLKLAAVYSWKIEAVAANTYQSEPTSFVTSGCEMIDDFEDAFGWTGDGVVETVIRDGSSQSMAIAYDDTGGVVSEATLALGGRDMSYAGSNAALLHIRFHGAIGNSPEQMYLKINDGSTTVAVAYDGDPSDLIQNSWEAFKDWYVDLTDSALAGVALSSVDSITIGLGNGIANGNAGTVYIDNIRICVPMCVSSRVDADIVGNDCVIGSNDLAMLALDWLDAARTVTPETLAGDPVVRFEFESIVDPDATPDTGDEYIESVVGTATAGVVDSPVIVSGVNGGNAAEVSNGKFMINDIATLLAGSQDLTITMWVKGSAAAATANPATGKLPNSMVYKQGQVLRMKLPGADGNAAVGGAYGGLMSYLSVQLDISEISGTWQHYAAVIDSTNNDVSFYINGVKVSGLTRSETVPAYSDNIPTVWAIPESYSGSIDDYRIYDRALSQGEVMTIAGVGSFVQPNISVADITGDGKVNLTDFARISQLWLDTVLWP